MLRPCAPPQAREGFAQMPYAAFVSYSHKASSAFSRELCKGIRTYSRPWFRPRKVFRDEDELVPDNELPVLIQRRLWDSEFLVLLASPDAACSVWVQDELVQWCGILGRTDRLIIVLTAGAIEVDRLSKNILWEQTDALPELLSNFMARVPLYVDARGIAGEKSTPNDPQFIDCLNRVVARIEGQSPAEMFGEERRRRRRITRGILSAAGAFLALGAVASVLAFRNDRLANQERRKSELAEERLHLSETRRAAMIATALGGSRPMTRLRAALFAAQFERALDVSIDAPRQALRDALHDVEATVELDRGAPIRAAALGHNPERLLWAEGEDGTTLVEWQIGTASPSILCRHDTKITSILDVDGVSVFADENGRIGRMETGGAIQFASTGLAVPELTRGPGRSVLASSEAGVAWLTDSGTVESLTIPSTGPFPHGPVLCALDRGGDVLHLARETLASFELRTDGTAALRKVTQLPSKARSLLVDPLSGELILGLHDNSVRRFDASSLEELSTIGALGAWPEKLAISPDGRLLIAGGRMGEVRGWVRNDSGAGWRQGGETLTRFYAAVADLSFSPDGGWLFARALGGVGADRDLRRWRLDPHRNPVSGGEILLGHESWVYALCVSGDAAYSFDSKGQILRWDLGAPRRGAHWVRSFESEGTLRLERWVEGVAVFNGNQPITLLGLDGAETWSGEGDDLILPPTGAGLLVARGSEPTAPRELRPGLESVQLPHSATPYDIVASEDGKWIVAAGDSVWLVRGPGMTAPELLDDGKAIDAVFVGNRLILVDRNDWTVVDFPSHHVARVDLSGEDDVSTLVADEARRRWFTITSGGVLGVWELGPTNEPLRVRTLELGEFVTSEVLEPFSGALLVGTSAGNVIRWSPELGKTVLVSKLESDVATLCVSPDGALLAIGTRPAMDASLRAKVLLADLSRGTSPAEIVRLSRSDEWPWDMTFGSDSRWLYVASDRAVRCYATRLTDLEGLAIGIAGRALRPEESSDLQTPSMPMGSEAAR